METCHLAISITRTPPVRHASRRRRLASRFRWSQLAGTALVLVLVGGAPGERGLGTPAFAAGSGHGGGGSGSGTGGGGGGVGIGAGLGAGLGGLGGIGAGLGVGLGGGSSSGSGSGSAGSGTGSGTSGGTGIGVGAGLGVGLGSGSSGASSGSGTGSAGIGTGTGSGTSSGTGVDAGVGLGIGLGGSGTGSGTSSGTGVDAGVGLGIGLGGSGTGSGTGVDAGVGLGIGLGGSDTGSGTGSGGGGSGSGSGGGTTAGGGTGSGSGSGGGTTAGGGTGSAGGGGIGGAGSGEGLSSGGTGSDLASDDSGGPTQIGFNPLGDIAPSAAPNTATRLHEWRWKPGVLPAVQAFQFSAGTVVYLSSGGFLKYLDVHGETVTTENAAHNVATRPGGFFTPASGSTYDASALQGLWPLKVGKTVQFIQHRDQDAWRQTVKVLRTESVAVPAGRFDTFVVQRESRGLGANNFLATYTYWYAPYPGAIVKYQVDQQAGAAVADRSWVATHVLVADSMQTSN